MSSVINVVICDSSTSYMEELKARIQQVIDYNGYNMNITMLTTKTSQVMDYVETDDGMTLYILDVAYPGNKLLGLQLARTLREENRNAYIVFNTFDESAIHQVMKGLIRPAGFFMKPIDKDDLIILMGDIYRDYLNLQGDKEEIFHVNIKASIYKLPYNQILYFESYQKKIYLHTHNQRIGFYESLANLKGRLSFDFLRCHRSYLVNVKKIKTVSFTDMILIMENGTKIDLSRTYKQALKSRMESLDIL